MFSEVVNFQYNRQSSLLMEYPSWLAARACIQGFGLKSDDDPISISMTLLGCTVAYQHALKPHKEAQDTGCFLSMLKEFVPSFLALPFLSCLFFSVLSFV